MKGGKPRVRAAARKDAAANYQVFVSHATADKWVARMLCEKIEQVAGATTFRDDRDIHGGDDIPAIIRREIIRSKEMVVLLTPRSAGRPWVVLEIGMAFGRRSGYRVTALLYHAGPEALPSMIEAKKAVNLNEVDSFLEDLTERVSAWRS